MIKGGDEIETFFQKERRKMILLSPDKKNEGKGIGMVSAVNHSRTVIGSFFVYTLLGWVLS